MAIYAISDLHLSFGMDKPMDIFGDNWEKAVDECLRAFVVVVACHDTVVCEAVRLRDFPRGQRQEQTPRPQHHTQHHTACSPQCAADPPPAADAQHQQAQRHAQHRKRRPQ